MSDIGVENLAIAICSQAADDFRKAVRKYRRYCNHTYYSAICRRDLAVKDIHEVIQFFKSEWCRFLTGDTGLVLLEKLIHEQALTDHETVIFGLV